MPWFRGSTLLHELETVYIGSDANHVDPRFPVQWVIRPNSDEHHDFRGSRAASPGSVQTGRRRGGAAFGFTTRVSQLFSLGTPTAEAFSPMSAVMTLEDDIDISRGDMIAKPANLPRVSQDIEVMACCFPTRS